MGNSTSRGYVIDQAKLALPPADAVVFSDGDLVDVNPTVASDKEAPLTDSLCAPAFELQAPTGGVRGIGLSHKMTYTRKVTQMLHINKASPATSTVPRTLTAADINRIIASPYSGLAFYLNWHVARRLMGGKTGGELNTIALAYSLAAVTNSVTHLLVLEADAANPGKMMDQTLIEQKAKAEGVSTADFTAIGAAPFNRTAACKNLAPSDWIKACTLLSRDGVSAFARRHKLGAFACPPGIKPPSGTSDKFISRAMQSYGLSVSSESDRALYYRASKALDCVSIVYGQIATAMKAEPPLIGPGCQCDWSPVMVLMRFECDSHQAPLFSTPLDKTSLPRLAGGPAGRRVLARAFTAAIESHECGIAYITGTGIDVKRIVTTLMEQIPVFHLQHPSIVAALPMDVKKLFLQSSDTLLYQSVRRILAAAAAYNEGRTGDKCSVPSDCKAMLSFPAITETARSWGQNFSPKRLDETTSAKLAAALSAVSGLGSTSITDADALRGAFTDMTGILDTERKKAEALQFDVQTTPAILDMETEKLLTTPPDPSVIKTTVAAALTQVQTTAPQQSSGFLAAAAQAVANAFGGDRKKRARKGIPEKTLATMLDLPEDFFDGFKKAIDEADMMTKLTGGVKISAAELGLTPKLMGYFAKFITDQAKFKSDVWDGANLICQDQTVLRFLRAFVSGINATLLLSPADLSTKEARETLYIQVAGGAWQVVYEIKEFISEQPSSLKASELGFAIENDPEDSADFSSTTKDLAAVNLSGP